MNTKRLLRVFLLVACVVCFASQAWAVKAVGYEVITPGTSTALPLTAATITSLSAANPDLWVMVQCQTYPVAYLFYGTPTAATVLQMAVGDTISFNGVALMRSFKAIGLGGTANLAVTYLSGH